MVKSISIYAARLEKYISVMYLFGMMDVIFPYKVGQTEDNFTRLILEVDFL
jgi:hypothetical protein